jgi:hypothetical protein
MGRDFGCFEFETGDGGSTVFGGQHGFWAGKTRVGGKHRTEVTEVTEGDGGSRVQRFLVDSMASGRETPASGKASHRGHRGGLELEGATLFGGQIGFWAGKTRTRESLTGSS